MDGNQRAAIERRAAELWAAAGSPAGQEPAYRMQAQQQLANASVAGEEDPLSGVEADALATGSSEDALRRSVADAVPMAERLPSGADENPISERVSDEAAGQPASPERSPLQGGTEGTS